MSIDSKDVESVHSTHHEELIDGPIDFSTQIRPILNQHCIACHGGVKKSGGLSYLFPEEALKKGESGNFAIVKGSPDQSYMIDRILDHKDPMPPEEHGAMLSAHEVALLKQWIKEGAKWSDHWAFISPKEQKIPTVQNKDWPRNDIDRFILARLEAEGMTPSKEADKRHLLRRVTLDLVGLPPSEQEYADFLADESPEAYEKVVSRLLDSPHFGERWASMWMDVIRYADSRGLGQDQHRTIWRYRDWIIDAFNRDLPFDLFTIKQIAGDLLPNPSIDDLIATAAHRNTQSNDEGGTNDEEFRVTAVMDRVSTTWVAWQGTTFECIQCHSHPYDPFRHEEYFEFYAFFNNTVDTDDSLDSPLLHVAKDRSQEAKFHSIQTQIQQAEKQVWESFDSLARKPKQWTPLRDLKPTIQSKQTKIHTETRGGIDQFYTTGTPHSNTQLSVTAPLPKDLNTLAAIRLNIWPFDPEKAKWESEIGVMLSYVQATVFPPRGKPFRVKLKKVIADEPHPQFDPNLSLNSKTSDGYSAWTRINHHRSCILLPEEATEIPAGSELKIDIHCKKFLLAAFPLNIKRGSIDVSSSSTWQETLSSPAITKSLAQIQTLKAAADKIPSTTVPIMSQRPDERERESALFVRGNWLEKGQIVTANVPDSFPQIPKDQKKDRLAMAQWLTSGANPLTSRVVVNRFWQQLFGIGIVETLEDFGSAGALPYHPELLDHLALQFQGEMKWSMKSIIREMVLSSSYRQHSAASPQQLAHDPQNRLLSRGPRNRLSAEMVRDQALAVSGLLSEHRYGEPAFPHIPQGGWRPFNGADKGIWKTPKTEARYRRTLYTHWQRSSPHPFMAAFDAPIRDVCTPRRVNSNTPVQPLMTLNDQAFFEAAQALAVAAQSTNSEVEKQISSLFRRITLRNPTEHELKKLTELYKISLSEYQSNQTESLKVAKTPELAALTIVSNIALNLDEILTH